MEKPYYKAILLVLASDNAHIYKFFKQVYESYMNENPNVRVFFVYGAGTNFERKEYDLVYDDLKETPMPPWMTMKVIRAMEYIDQNYDYDFLVRTNLSTFWDFNALLERLETMPKERCLSGKIGIFPPPFVTGIAMTISRDLIKEIVKKPHLVNIYHPKYVAEDRMISEFFTDHLDVPIIDNITSLAFETEDAFVEEEIIKKIEKAKASRFIDHYRVKNRADRMGIDTKVSQLLCKMIYGKDLNIRVGP